MAKTPPPITTIMSASSPLEFTLSRPSTVPDYVDSKESTFVSKDLATASIFDLEKLSSKLQQRIFHFLDFETLLKCRQVSKTLKTQVDKMDTVPSQKMATNLPWNPFFSTRKYHVINTQRVMGLIRLGSAEDVKSFVQKNSNSTKRLTGKVRSETPKTVAVASNNNNSMMAPPKKLIPLTPPTLSPTSSKGEVVVAALATITPLVKPKALKTTREAVETPKKHPSATELFKVASTTATAAQLPSTSKANPSTSKAPAATHHPVSSKGTAPTPHSVSSKGTEPSPPPGTPKAPGTPPPPATLKGAGASPPPATLKAAGASPPPATSKAPAKSRPPATSKAPAASPTPVPKTPVPTSTAVSSAPVSSKSPENSNAAPPVVSKSPSAPSKKPQIFKNNSSMVSPLFPLGSLSIHRRLDSNEYDVTSSPDDDTNAVLTPDSNDEIVEWTARLAQDFGRQLTSFTFDDGKKHGSDLSFSQLGAILSYMPNLIFLSVTSGNYEHYNFDDNLGERGEVEVFPPLPSLKYCTVGYNSTFHLHMDIMNAYGTQLKRLSFSKFGEFIENSDSENRYVATTNSLHRLFDYINSILALYPEVLSSVEELKVPVLSSQNLMGEVTADPEFPIRLPNLKRLSLYYMHHPTGEEPSESDYKDIFCFLNKVSANLEELFFDFGSCTDFIHWLSDNESSPSTCLTCTADDVYQALPKVKNLAISGISLLRCETMANMIASKFAGLQNLTFFNFGLYQSEAEEHGFDGQCFSGGPKNLDDVAPFMLPFWDSLPTLETISILMGTLQGDGYSENRKDRKTGTTQLLKASGESSSPVHEKV